MKLLKIVGIAFFFIHYYIVIFFALLKNMLTYLWKTLTQTHTAKPHHISPFSATHPQVFAHISNRSLIQFMSSPRRAFKLTFISFQLLMELRCQCGESERQKEAWTNPTLSS